MVLTKVPARPYTIRLVINIIYKQNTVNACMPVTPGVPGVGKQLLLKGTKNVFVILDKWLGHKKT